MGTVTTLHVFQSEADEGLEEVFLIDEAVYSCSKSRRKNLWTKFTKIGNESDSRVLRAIWPHLVLPGRDYGALLTLLVVFDSLTRHLEGSDYSRIEVHGVKHRYEPVITDAIEATDPTVELCIESTCAHNETGFGLSHLVTVLELFLDQLISLLLKPIFWSTTDSQTVIMPYPNRYGSIVPVVEELETTATIVPTHLTIRWLLTERKVLSVNRPTRPLHTFTSLSVLFDQIRDVFSLLFQSRRQSWEIESELDKALTEMDVNMPNTISSVCSRVIPDDIRSIVRYRNFVHLFDTVNPSSFVVVGMNSRERLALDAAAAADCERFYVPHSVITGVEVMPVHADTTHFVAGSFELEYLRGSSLSESLSQLVPAGRPYLVELREKYADNQYRQPESLTVLIATQPYTDPIREAYLKSVIPAIKQSDAVSDCIIKVHPAESPSYYESLLDEFGYSTVPVETGDIGPYLATADLTVTISSNVGLEAVFAGSSCVSYNPWEPVVPTSPYLEDGPFSVFTAQDELRSFFTGLDKRVVNDQFVRQQNFIQNRYKNESAAKKIAECIQS